MKNFFQRNYLQKSNLLPRYVWRPAFLCAITVNTVFADSLFVTTVEYGRYEIFIYFISLKCIFYSIAC